MKREQSLSLASVARLVRRCLRDGTAVEIAGLGTFRPRQDGAFTFTAHKGEKVFIAYAEDDLPHAWRLYEALSERGFDPWLDKKKLLPGQNWPRAIEQAISVSDYFVACCSRQSVSQKSHFQSELRYALDCATMVPLEDIFLLPVRLENCAVPRAIMQNIQYVDLFPDWQAGFERLLAVIEEQRKRRRERLAEGGE